ncbi:plasmid replication initiator TrfA [Uliginosibacterium sp. TH139]|uniref:plasmid replication initiator TrfA n=1 Tax=Uliginosibacterium sp. TH139 TaxID=2067453 RepID=UPI000C7B76AF|nr:plasmid replication initiator TrfA [Uliginosibacterium sp. TH139]PLK48312.1 hypothetical protein C0V76_13920 [Uliginosibacterium sp. TH139]
MAKRNNAEQIAELQAQAAATRRAAEAAADVLTQDLAFAAAATLESVARHQLRRKTTEEAPVLLLPDNASIAEVRQARLRRAVQRGKDVFLPTWREATVGIPNALLRSSLFSAAGVTNKPLMNLEIRVQGDTSLTLTGHPLGDYDRRVFAACLNYYRDDRPLCPGSELRWVTVTFWQLARNLNVSYCANTHQAIRDSLIRLNAAHLRIRVKRVDIPMPRLLDVLFDDGYQGKDTPARLLKGSDLISFRILESMATLFGPEDWSAVSEAALHDYSGLPAWLASYYSTHAKPFPVKVEDLFRWSGVVCEFREFRRRLKLGLERLQRVDVPEKVRLVAYELTNTHLTVELERWKRSS